MGTIACDLKTPNLSGLNQLKEMQVRVRTYRHPHVRRGCRRGVKLRGKA